MPPSKLSKLQMRPNPQTMQNSRTTYSSRVRTIKRGDINTMKVIIFVVMISAFALVIGEMIKEFL